MKDQWVNIGYEDDKLKPYAEPSLSLDQKRIGTLDLFSTFLLISQCWSVVIGWTITIYPVLSCV